MWTLIFTWCNLVILFLLVKKFLFAPVQAILDKRKSEIDDMYTVANSAIENANILEQEYTQKLAVAKDEARDIIKTATLTAQRREEEILN